MTDRTAKPEAASEEAEASSVQRQEPSSFPSEGNLAKKPLVQPGERKPGRFFKVRTDHH